MPYLVEDSKDDLASIKEEIKRINQKHSSGVISDDEALAKLNDTMKIFRDMPWILTTGDPTNPKTKIPDIDIWNWAMAGALIRMAKNHIRPGSGDFNS